MNNSNSKPCHVCDECGQKGPVIGLHEKIIFWICDKCLNKMFEPS